MLYGQMKKHNTALVVIDVVNGCAHEQCEHADWGVTFSKVRNMVPKLEAFIKSFRQLTNNPLVFVNLQPWTAEYLPGNIKTLYTDPKVSYYSNDTSGFPEEFYGITPTESDWVITKNSYDAFCGTGLEERLRERGIQFLVIAGVFTEGCVLATVANGFSRGFNFVLLKDLIETGDGEQRQRLSADIKERLFPYLYGQTINAGDFLREWNE